MIKLKKILESENLLEWSKNDPIPEINRIHKKLALFIFGPPGIGKSTFVRDYILTKNPNFKVVNPDDINKTLTGDPIQKQWNPDSSNLAVTLIKNLTKSGSNFIYDVTGNSFERVKIATMASKENDYTVIYIHMIGELNKSISQNKKRERQVSIDFLTSSYNKSQQLMVRYSNELKPDSYYIVLHLATGYKFFKYENNILLKRKVDKYIPVTNK